MFNLALALFSCNFYGFVGHCLTSYLVSVNTIKSPSLLKKEMVKKTFCDTPNLMPFFGANFTQTTVFIGDGLMS